MGSFNVTCCVTKTPIIIGDECVLVVFKRPDDISVFTDGESGRFMLESSIYSVYKGKYDDYGELDVEHPDIRDEGNYIGFFISKHAWDLGETLTTEPCYEGQMRYIADRFELRNSIKKLRDELLKKNSQTHDDMSSIVNGINGIVGEFSIVEQDLKILICLKLFCSHNNINMLDPSFENWYGSQQLNVDEKERWNKLRIERTEYLKNKEKEWENE